MIVASFFVHAQVGSAPQPKGSADLSVVSVKKTHKGRVVLQPDGKPVMLNRAVMHTDRALLHWEQLIAFRCRIAMAGRAPLDEPVSLGLVFHMPRDQAQKLKLGGVRTVRSSHDAPDVKPDLDKICRAVLDGLKTGGAYVDDARVTEFHQLRKVWAPSLDQVGVSIEIKTLSRTTQPELFPEEQ